MKRLTVILMAVGMFGAMPAFAAHDSMKMEHECARQCALQAESIQQKIKRIQAEIKKGSKKYSAEDMKTLQGKLQETQKLLDDMTKGP